MSISTRTGAGTAPAGMLLLLMALTGLGQMATNLVVPSLARMVADLSLELEQAGLIISALLLGIGLGQLVVGPMSDRYGRRPVLLAGLVLYVLAGIGAVLAESGGALLLARLLQGFGASAGLALPRAIARDRFEGALFLRVTSLLTLAMAVMPGLAPAIGAAVAGRFGWRAALAVSAAAGALALLAVLLSLPESHHARRRGGGLADSLAGYARVLRCRPFLAYALASGAAIGGAYAEVAAAQALFQGHLGWATGSISLAAALFALGFLAGGLAAPRLRLGPAQRIQLGIALMLGSALALLGLALAGRLSGEAAIALIMLSQAGVGCMAPPAIGLALLAVEGAAGTASAVLGALHMALGAASAAVIGLLAAQIAPGLPAVLLGFSLMALLALRLARPGRG
ncbi:MFS transporter [Pseudoroseomonas cervicalis]|uniref:MFS transporter n=1 Tax=Teichococcus cervicalis TaxID=204525 RepID=UPI0022F1B6DC|nr:MFS transporter [Pseudoroseomonas cervicalis]WBV45264.1 MFS transporter [Pseudoroseomonas cervicalis]